VSVGAYPGTFNPPTVAHLAIAEAARRQGSLDRVDLIVSIDPLGKSGARLAGGAFTRRLAMLEALTETRPWLSVRTTDRRLVSDIASGYDALVLGSDKWQQVVDPSWYGGSTAARDAAVLALPRLLLAPRASHGLPSPLPAGAVLLELDEWHAVVSSTAVRAGRKDWIAPEAGAYNECRNPQKRAD
jgi:nicotinic acid mononucleotide adenylyltransferase